MDDAAEGREQLLALLKRRAEHLREEPARRGLEVPLAHVAAWSLLAAVNAWFVTRVPNPKEGTRVLHHLYDAGHLLFVGAFLGVSAWALRRVIRNTRGWTLPFAVATAPAVVFLRGDFAGFISQALSESLAFPLSLMVAVCFAATPVLGFSLARRLPHWSLRVLAVAGGVGVQYVNNVALESDYRGIHMFAALNAGALVAGALARAKSSTQVKYSLVARIVPAVALLASVPSMAVQPSNAVRQQLARVEGAIIVPVLARFGWGVSHGKARVPPELHAWFEDRNHLDAIAPTEPPVVPRKDLIVILVGVDSMRADIFEKPSNAKRLPNLFDLKKNSVDFSMTRSPGARTITTWSAVFSGRFYTGLFWSGDGGHLSIRNDKQIRFPELLTKAGVTTVTYQAYGQLDGKNLARNFTESHKVSKREGQQFGLSTEAMPPFLERLRKHQDGRLFLWTHLMDPHYPYDSVVDKGPPKERFMKEVEQIDKAIGDLQATIDELGIRDRTVLIVVADHGEGFGQHGARYHTVNLYEEAIRVPMFISGPGIKPRKITQPTSLVDLGPTILDLYGQKTPGHVLAQSLVPFLKGEDPKLTRPIAAERQGTRTLVFDKTKVIIDEQNGREEIYDLEKDPAETDNLADDLGEEGTNLLNLVNLYFETHRLPSHRSVPR